MLNNPFQNLPQGWEVKTLGEVCEILDNMRNPLMQKREKRDLRKQQINFHIMAQQDRLVILMTICAILNLSYLVKMVHHF